MDVNDDQKIRLDIVKAVHSLGFEIATQDELQELLTHGKAAMAASEAKSRDEGKTFVTEESDKTTIDEWWSYAKGCKSIDDAAAFAHRLVDAYHHDYGTICHAIAASGLAMANAVEQSPQGHITGFQGGAIGWMWMRHWNQWDDAPRQLVDWSNLLYPQYDRKMTTISPETALWLQGRARDAIASSAQYMHESVKQRHEEIADGRFPAFITVEKD